MKPGTLAHRLLNLTSSPTFHYDLMLIEKLEKIQFLLDHPFSCKFCGIPTDIPQEDQREPVGFLSTQLKETKHG